MEERESLACRDGKDDQPPPPPLSPLPPPPPYIPVSLPVEQAGISKRPPETYVVHFPRDQVYRVPPPENARIAESHRPKNNNKSSGKGGGGGGGCSLCRLIIIALILVALGISIFIAMVLTLYSPKYPEFSLEHFHAKSNGNNSSPRKNNNNNYSVSLTIKNPNERMEVQYGSGKMSLKFKGKVIASGKYLSTQQEAAKEIVVLETLHGNKKSLTKSMAKSLMNNKDKHPKSMVLIIYVPIKITSWAITSQKYLIVTCDFKVKMHAKTGTKIISQECGTKL